MGESYGAWRMGRDGELMDHVSSVNIACGFHAGDPTTIRSTVEIALAKGKAVGAHPSYPDLQGFGRREMALSQSEIFDAVLYQVAAVRGICESLGGRLSHVKPHGALYNRAARDRDAADAIAEAVRSIDDSLVLFGLAGSELIEAAAAAGLTAASEVFADRTYSPDGSLTPRSQPRAVITDTNDAAAQVAAMLQSGTVTAIDGSSLPITADTVCIHGDGPNALEFARAISSRLTAAGYHIRPVSQRSE